MSAPHIAGFMDRMNEVGLGWDDPRYSEPIDDGTLHRYHVDGDKSGNYNGWYVLHGGRYPAGAFGSWRTGESITWSMKDDKTLSPYELEEMHQQRKQQRDKLNRDIADSREKAYQACRNIWSKSTYPEPNHPYLIKKQVGIFGIRQYKDLLVIPVQDVSGQLVSLQFISPSGEKRFKSGGKVKGCFHRIGKPKDKIIYIAEGYATAATIHEPTGHSVAAALALLRSCQFSVVADAKDNLYRLKNLNL